MDKSGFESLVFEVIKIKILTFNNLEEYKAHLVVKVSWFSVPKTLIVCNDPIIRAIAATWALESAIFSS